MPDGCRKAASSDVIHRRIVVVADPYPDNDFRSEADKPGVPVILCRSGFSTGGSRDTRGFTGPLTNYAAQKVEHGATSCWVWLRCKGRSGARVKILVAARNRSDGES